MQLDAELLSKEGSICILGDAPRGVNWGNIVADLFLAKSLLLDRFKTVFCMVSDRSSSLILKRGSSKLRLCPSDQMEELFQSGVPEHSALFVYSLSDVILFRGMRRGLKWITDSEAFALRVFVIHPTLHRKVELTLLKKTCETTVLVHPNDGSMSEEIAIETHTVRRSRTSGRVVERRDLFRLTYGEDDPSGVASLAPILIRKTSPEDSSSQSKETQESPSESNASNQKEIQPRSVYQSRLITFDSNDPEFDDDSDPDHDLDL